MSYTNNRDIRAFPASAAVAGYLIVAAAGSEDKVRAGAAATNSLVGVSERVGAEVGTMLDVTVAGETEVLAGGNLAFNDPITSNAQGQAIKAVPAAGQIVSVVGYMRSASAVPGDIVRIHVAPFLIAPLA